MLHSLSISHLPASFKNSILISIAKCPRLLPGLSTALSAQGISEPTFSPQLPHHHQQLHYHRL